MNEFKFDNLDNNPILKQLIKIYISAKYEENAIYDDHHVLMELNLLIRDNELLTLIGVESLINNFQKRC